MEHWLIEHLLSILWFPPHLNYPSEMGWTVFFLFFYECWFCHQNLFRCDGGCRYNELRVISCGLQHMNVIGRPRFSSSSPVSFKWNSHNLETDPYTDLYLMIASFSLEQREIHLSLDWLFHTVAVVHFQLNILHLIMLDFFLSISWSLFIYLHVTKRTFVSINWICLLITEYVFTYKFSRMVV